MKLACWFWRRFLELVNIFAIPPLSPTGERHSPTLEQIESPRKISAKFGPSGEVENENFTFP
jgi:hypothetical protein